ncbi:MAG TPA: ABC transporter ATP-binding protein, partial [Herpetosiphonaceae bacterium]
DLAAIEEATPTSLRYRTADAARLNPALIARLMDLDTPLLAIAEVPRSLEDVYLTIVGQTHRERTGGVQSQPEVPELDLAEVA